MADADRNGPLAPHMRPCAPRCRHCLMGEDPQASAYNFWRLRGCMALKTLQCCGDASLLDQRSALRAICPLTPLKIITACLGGCCPSIQRINVGIEASFGVLGGHFCRHWPWLWWWLCVFCSVPEHKPLFPVEPWHIGYCRKALVLSKTILVLYWCCDLELKEKWRKCTNLVHRSATYPRFLTIVVSGAYALMVLMPWPMVVFISFYCTGMHLRTKARHFSPTSLACISITIKY